MKTNLLIVVAVAMASLALASCGKSHIYYNQSPEEIITIAKNEGRPFCFVVISDTCTTLYSEYLAKVDRYKIDKKAIVNIVKMPDTNPDNWYRQWLCTYNPIVTCLFSKEGELKATIAGNSKYSFDFLGENIKSAADNVDFGYRPLFTELNKEKRIAFLNDVFRCKIGLDRGVDVKTEIDHTLSITKYPFNVYLRYLSEKSKDSKDGSAEWAKKLLEFDNEIPYYSLYADLFEQAYKEIDPNYDFEILPIMEVKETEIVLTGCRMEQPHPFEINVTNTGKTNLIFKKIDLGCSCITLVSQGNPAIKPSESYDMKFLFTPDKEGDITREVTILSNAQNKIETIHIKALSVEKGGNSYDVKM